MKKSKLTLIDFLIILCVIFAIVFAIIHISSENSNETVSFDKSTLNKIVENYLPHYMEGKIVKTTVDGYNASTGKEQEIKGEIKWIDDSKGSNVKVLIDVDGKPILAGLYEDIPQADIYIEKISLETDGTKYKNITEITLNPKNISNINDLVNEFNNYTDYEVSTVITVNEIDNIKIQELTNELYNNNGRISFKPSLNGFQTQIIITRASDDEINIANNILEDVDGVSNEITIRIYNLTQEDINKIENSSTIKNIRKIN